MVEALTDYNCEFEVLSQVCCPAESAEFNCITAFYRLLSEETGCQVIQFNIVVFVVVGTLIITGLEIGHYEKNSR